VDTSPAQEGTGNVLYPTLISMMDLSLKVLLCLVESQCGDSIDNGGDFGLMRFALFNVFP
jgi:hypothetical protein